MTSDPFESREFENQEFESSATSAETSEQQPLRIWPVFVAPILALVLALLLQAVVGGVMAAMLLAQGVQPDDLTARLVESMTSPGVFILIAGVAQTAFFLTAILAGVLSPQPFRKRLGFLSVPNTGQVYFFTIVGSILPLAVALLGAVLLAKVLPADESLEALFAKMTPLWGLAFVVFIGLAPGLSEEMLFRGYMQRRLLRRWRPFWAIGVVSVIFALVHVQPHTIVAAFPLGIWLGVIAWRTNSIGPGIACHAFVNSGLNAWRMVVKFGEVPETVQNVCHIVFVVIGGICFVIACRLLARCTPADAPSRAPVPKDGGEAIAPPP